MTGLFDVTSEAVALYVCAVRLDLEHEMDLSQHGLPLCRV